MIWLGALAVSLVAGLAIGWSARSVSRPPSQPVVLVDAIEALDEVERRTGGVVEILNDMAAGTISRDEDALRTLRDSMQEITEAIGDVISQLQVLRQSPR